MILMDYFVRKTLGDWWAIKAGVNKTGWLRYYYEMHYYRILRNNACSIMPKSQFKSKPALPHGLSGIFISSGAKIGRNSVIFQQVTIGAVTTLDSKYHGSPILGDNCFIGSGAKIIGNIRIGNNVRVGANAVIYNDVPDNSIVTSGSQKVVTKDILLDNTYYFPRNGVWYYAKDGEFIKCPNNGKKPAPNSL